MSDVDTNVHNNGHNNGHLNNHYIYIWRHQGVFNSGLAFYVGQGTHQYTHGRSKYRRAYEIHIDKGQKNGKLSYAQKKANKLAREGCPHIVNIIHDNLTQKQADDYEMAIISRLGRKHLHTGILYNLSAGGEVNPMADPIIKEKHNKIVKSKVYSDNMKVAMAHVFTDEYSEKKRIEMINRMADPVKKADWYKKFISPENIENLRNTHIGTKIYWNGNEYRSKKELARFLGISSQALNYRISNNIVLDTPIKPRKNNG